MDKKLGRDYAKLWTASAMSSLGDGVTLAAGPLLMATLTSDPAVVAGAAFAQQLPWLLFSLFSGVFVDRIDRRRLVVLVDVLRGLVLAGLAVLVWQGAADVLVVYVAVFLLGVGSTLADNAAQAITPSLVPAALLPRANARLMGARTVGHQFAGPPLGGLLFVVAAGLPFGFDAASYLVGAALVASLRWRPAAVVTETRRSVRQDIAEGVRWLWRHRALRMLALAIALMNITYGGTMAVLVLYAKQELGLSEVGYGFLLASTAVGGLIGTLIVARLEARFGSAMLLRVGLVVETLTHLVLAVTRTPWVAMGILVMFGVHATIWSVTGVSLRQRVIPAELFGRVNSVYFLFSMGGMALGSLLGGAVAQVQGVTAPMWVAFGAMTVMTAVAWRTMTPARLASGPAPA